MTIQGQTAYSYFGLATFANLTAVVETALDNGAMPVTLGGDHSITFPIIQAYQGCGPLTILHFDAHMDYRDEIMGVRFGHGSCMRRAIEFDYVEQIVSCGIRSLRTGPGDVRDSLAAGNEIIPPWEIRAGGISERLPAGKDVYISFDIDGMDMVEVSPEYDVGQITSLLAAQLIDETPGFAFPGDGD